MDVLTIIFYVVVAGFALYAALFVLGWAYFLLPLILGLWGGIWLWNHGHDNWGIIVGIAGFPLMFVWLWLITGQWRKEERSSGSDYSSSKPYNTKTAYDKDGNVSGYIEKD